MTPQKLTQLNLTAVGEECNTKAEILGLIFSRIRDETLKLRASKKYRIDLDFGIGLLSIM